MPDNEDYEEVARSVRAAGFTSVSASDVADTHRRMQRGEPPSGITDREIRQHLEGPAALSPPEGPDENTAP